MADGDSDRCGSGMPPLSIPVALLLFNVSVEIAQLLFIAAVLAAVAAGRRVAKRISWQQPDWLWRVHQYANGGLAIYCVIERVAAF